MKTTTQTLLSIIFAALVSGPVAADSQNMSENSSGQAQTSYTTDDLLGQKIISQDGKEVGTIDELVFDASGRISYFVVSRGGFIGLNEDKVLVPWSHLGQLDQASKAYTSKFDADTINRAPTLSSSDIDNFADPQTRMEADTHFGSSGAMDSGMAGESGREKARQEFAKYDNDSNGVLDRDEARNASELSRMFQQVDKNSDGSISRAEYMSHVEMDE